MPPDAKQGPRYRFADFTVSPSRRILLRAGTERPLIPRYFDLLLLLVTRRNEAVHRQEILDRVWKDVVVSDGALSQAVRTLRRTLGDDSRSPSFIRTLSRHGYRFVFADVVEEDDAAPLPLSDEIAGGGPPDSDPWEPWLERLLEESSVATESDEEGDNGRREAAEALHVLGTSETLRRLEGRQGTASARALLRDARWDVPTAGPVPLLGEPEGLLAAYYLLQLRLRRAVRLARRRWAAAATGGALAGWVSGIAGAMLLRFGPGSEATDAVIVALGVVGLAIGGIGAAGVGAGLAAAEALFRSFRRGALVLLGALGGGVVGAAGHLF